MTGAIIAEAVDVYAIVHDPDAAHVFKKFIGYTIVTKIGSIMALTLTNVNVAGDMSMKPLMWGSSNQKVTKDIDEIKEWRKENKMNVLEWAGMLTALFFCMIARFIYQTVYYYFLSYFIVVIVNFSDYAAKNKIG